MIDADDINDQLNEFQDNFLRWEKYEYRKLNNSFKEILKGKWVYKLKFKEMYVILNHFDQIRFVYDDPYKMAGVEYSLANLSIKDQLYIFKNEFDDMVEDFSNFKKKTLEQQLK